MGSQVKSIVRLGIAERRVCVGVGKQVVHHVNESVSTRPVQRGGPQFSAQRICVDSLFHQILDGLNAIVDGGPVEPGDAVGKSLRRLNLAAGHQFLYNLQLTQLASGHELGQIWLEFLLQNFVC